MMKTVKKFIGIILTLVMMLSCLVFTSSASDTVNLPKQAGTVLTSGTYVIDKYIFIMASSLSGQSALEIAEGATVTLEFRNNAQLEVWGATASTYIRKGSGAGIRVPESSTLYITGTGTLIAKGGDASDGYDAIDGNDGESKYCSADWGHSGYGGDGGRGGNGAGAGIGGAGGIGGEGGEGGEAVDSDNGDPADCVSGKAGGNGEDGTNGETMGTVIVIGNGVTVKATGGSSGKNGKGGMTGKNSKYDGDTFSDASFGGGGGAGAGGFGGGSASSIGGGGFGGAGGGAGGSGVAVSNRYSSFTTDEKTGRGNGYTKDNTLDIITPIQINDKNFYGGSAGDCGTNGKKGGDGAYTVHYHDFDTVWSFNETVHWHVCKAEYCCYKDDYSDSTGASYGLHTGMKDGVCDTCGYVDVAVKSVYDAQCTAVSKVIETAGDNPSDSVMKIVNSAVASIRTISNIEDIETVKFFAISTVISLQTAESSAAELESVKGELAETNKKLDTVETELSETKNEIAKLTELLDKALEKLENGSEPENHTAPTVPDNTVSGICEKCGHTHANNIFGKIICFIYRLFNLFK